MADALPSPSASAATPQRSKGLLQHLTCAQSETDLTYAERHYAAPQSSSFCKDTSPENPSLQMFPPGHDRALKSPQTWASGAEACFWAVLPAGAMGQVRSREGTGWFG